LRQSGYLALTEARDLMQEQMPIEARDVLLDVERRYRPSSVAAEAKRLRIELETRPRVAQQLAARDQADARRKAADLWRAAQVALADARVEDAKRHCRNLLAIYPDSAPAADARRVLRELEGVSD
ncbi:MAG TPA: hypothetical protein VM243_19370, partial [Phycisphaerae bacterium]|nr:hypothetical protein [Phycisphaerae bacterium]